MTYAILQIAAGAYRDIRDRLTALDAATGARPSYASEYISEPGILGRPERLVFGPIAFEALPEPDQAVEGDAAIIAMANALHAGDPVFVARMDFSDDQWARLEAAAAVVRRPPVEDFTEAQREAIGEILETVARDGLPGPRDLDVALDAIGCTLRPT